MMTTNWIFLADLGLNSPYGLVIGASVILVLSYFFNLIAAKTNIPSPLLLIGLGIGAKLGLTYAANQGLIASDVIPYEDIVLEILGTIGLIFIVLEGALDLKLSREKWPVIWRSLVIALLSLVLGIAGIAGFFQMVLFDNWSQSIIYAIPLAVMSSAIVIPSVVGLDEDKKEFMIYESTFSDILGIMMFYMFLSNASVSSAGAVAGNVFSNIGLTLIFSLLVCYALVYVLQRINSQVKLFLTVAILALLYVIGKSFELSSLLMILVFGLMLNNHKVFWRSKLTQFIDDKKIKTVLHDFHVLTLETSFVIRTFFFVIFGMTITLASLLNLDVAFYSLVVVLVLYVVRLIFLAFFKRKDIFPLLYIAPRGLITILLFFKIPGEAPPEWVDESFNEGILLFVIIVTSVVMTISLIQNGLKPNLEMRDDVSELPDSALPENDAPDKLPPADSASSEQVN
ncbi:MAG: sodium:proton exchanger [Flavobacteriales bacterium]|nr:sodium:proton exchanger [Flavobacteriales bacterium]